MLILSIVGIFLGGLSFILYVLAELKEISYKAEKKNKKKDLKIARNNEENFSELHLEEVKTFDSSSDLIPPKSNETESISNWETEYAEMISHN